MSIVEINIIGILDLPHFDITLWSHSLHKANHFVFPSIIIKNKGTPYK